MRAAGRSEHCLFKQVNESVTAEASPLVFRSSMTIQGIHHVTAIAGDAQRNLDFYIETLGLRLVKRTVNFDDPGTYHFYFGDRLGRPGTIMTFFPWPRAAAGIPGAGIVTATAFSIPQDSAEFWTERLSSGGIGHRVLSDAAGESLVALRDPDGLEIALVADPDAETGPAVWGGGSVPEHHAIRSFHGATLSVRDPQKSARLLADVFGMVPTTAPSGRLRFVAPGNEPGRVIDIDSANEWNRGGRGTVHHIAFRARDDDEQRAWRERLLEAGLQVTQVLDRQYFRSVYFREPGGVLFEIATDGPGFDRDEPVERLGQRLKLPDWLETRRESIERTLPSIHLRGDA